MLRGTDIIPWNIPHLDGMWEYMGIFYGILSVPHDIAMDVNNVMIALYPTIIMRTWLILISCPTEVKPWSIVKTTSNHTLTSLTTGLLHLKSKLLTPYDHNTSCVVGSGRLSNFGPFQ